MHFGSRLVFDSEGNLYVSTGERSDIKTGQWLNCWITDMGKCLAQPDGKAAEGNPFLDVSSVLPEVYITDTETWSPDP